MSRQLPPGETPGPDGNIIDLAGNIQGNNAPRRPRGGRKPDKTLAVEDRRRQVAILRKHRLTLRQIVASLARLGFTNPQTGKPWSLKVVNDDVNFLTEQARAEAVRNIAEHKAEILGDYQELLRLAWVEQRYEDARLLLGDIRKLLGVDSPTVIIFQEVQARMLEGIQRLELAFADQPEVLERAIQALVGELDIATIAVDAHQVPVLPPAN